MRVIVGTKEKECKLEMKEKIGGKVKMMEKNQVNNLKEIEGGGEMNKELSGILEENAIKDDKTQKIKREGKFTMINLNDLKENILEIKNSINPVGEETIEDVFDTLIDDEEIELEDIEDYLELEDFLNEIGSNLINEIVDILVQDFAVKGEELKKECWSTWLYLAKREEFYKDEFKNAFKKQAFITFIKNI